MNRCFAVAISFITVSVVTHAQEPAAKHAHYPQICPFGHTKLIWRPVSSVCIPGPERELVCATCGFSYDENLDRWERAVGFGEVAPEVLPGFPTVIRDIPVPKQEKELKSVRYRQVRKDSVVLSESCLYWTGENVEATKNRIREYLVAAGFLPIERSRRYGPRVYSFFFAQSGNRFLRVEVMLESNEQVAVDARLVASSEIDRDYILREALGIDRPNKSPEATPDQRPPATPSRSSGMPQL